MGGGSDGQLRWSVLQLPHLVSVQKHLKSWNLEDQTWMSIWEFIFFCAIYVSVLLYGPCVSFCGSEVIVGVASTLQTTAGQAFGARNFEEVSLSLQRCMLRLGGQGVVEGSG